MAVNQTNAQAQQASQAAPQAATQAHQPAGSLFSFNQTNLFAPIAANVQSEYYAKFTEALRKLFAQANANVEVKVLDLDRSRETALKFSAVVVAMRRKDAESAGVAYHVLILEATGNALDPVTENIPGGGYYGGSSNYEILRVTSDAMDDVLARRAREIVGDAFPRAPLQPVDGCVVPRDFDPANTNLVQALALNAGLACNTVLETRMSAYTPMNLTHLVRDGQLEVSIQTGRNTIVDMVGSPVRSDVVVSFVSRLNKQNQPTNVINNGNIENQVSRVSGFVDLLWSPVVPQMGYNPYYSPAAIPTQKFIPRLVITDLVSEHNYTTGNVLLALTTAMTVRDDMNWFQCFRSSMSRNNKQDIDLGDVGALNIEGNMAKEDGEFGTPINTKLETFGTKELGVLITSLVQPGLMISLDCPDLGPETWYLSVFAAAARGSVEAYDAIYSAADALTDGHFSKTFAYKSEMFTDLGNRVHLGKWTDSSGKTRDIRDFDYLATANIVGESNPVYIRDWSETWLNKSLPIMQRLARRREMITKMSLDNAIFTGMADRVTFTHAFLDALSGGVQATKIPVRTVATTAARDFNQQRGVADFATAAALGSGRTFQQYGGQSDANAGYGMNTGYRW